MAPNSDAVRRRHGFHDSIWTEILCRLPSTKTVFRCKCVSKHWNSLISDKYFIHRFVDYHHENYGSDFNPDEQLMLINYCGFLKRDDLVFSASFGDHGPKQMDRLKLPLLGDEGSIQCNNIHGVQKSFNDLLLVSRAVGSLITYHVVNLFTKEHVELPLCDTPGIPFESTYMGFVCEPFYKQGVRQFNLDPNYRYRVVHVWDNRIETISIVTYCSETKKWNALGGLDPDDYGCDGNVVTHEMKLYWLNWADKIIVYDPFDASGGPRSIVPRFDKAPMWSPFVDFLLVESQGSLLLMELGKEEQSRYISIWKLKDGDGHGNESFRFECRVKINPITPHTSIFPKLEEIIFLQISRVHPSNRDIVFLQSLHSLRVASYNLRTKEWRVVGEEIEGSVDLDYAVYKFGVNAALPWWPTPLH